MGIQQLLLTTAGGGLGTVFLEPNRNIVAAATTNIEFDTAFANLDIQFQPNGEVVFQTLAQGEFTSQEGAGTYAWLDGGNASLYSLRYRTSPVSGFGSPDAAFDTWTPIGDGISFLAGVSATTFGSSDNVDEKNFFITFELAATSDTSNILASGQVDVLLRAVALGNDGNIEIQ